jgi:hypothetical protein
MTERAQLEMLYDGTEQGARELVTWVIGVPYTGAVVPGAPMIFADGFVVRPGDTLMRENFGTDEDPEFFHAVRGRTLH